MIKNKVPGGVAQLYYQGIPYSFYFGVESLDTKVSVTEKTVFEIGSITKLFTSLLLAQEINEGKVKLNDFLIKYLPYFSEYSENRFQQITLKKLATHTAGFPMMVSKNIQHSHELPEYFSLSYLLSIPGTEWRYSNIGTGLLGNALEVSANQDINSLYIDRLLQPLEMEKIGIHLSEKFQSHYAQGYTQEGYRVPHTHYAQHYNEEGNAISDFQLSLLPEAGAMKMTAADSLLFLKAAVGMPDVPSKIANAMKKTQQAYIHTQEMNQGLGWVIYSLNKNDKKTRKKLLNPNPYMNRWPEPAKNIRHPRFDGNALIDKTGLTSGFRSYIAVIPNKQSGIIILTNRYAINNEIMKIGREILLDIE